MASAMDSDNSERSSRRVERGDVRNYGLSRASKIFAFSCISKAFQKATKRNISVTDIDGAIEIGGYLLWFEFKTEGHGVPWGQEKLYKTVLYNGQRMKSILLLCEHKQMFQEDGGVKVPENVIRFQIHWFNYPVKRSDWIDGKQLQEFCYLWANAAEHTKDMRSVLLKFIEEDSL